MPSKKTKANTIKKIQTCLTSYQNILIGDAKNLPTEKIQNIRKALRKINTEVVCGNKVNYNLI